MKQYTIKELKRMNIGERRALLKALNKEARTRARRLIKHGYSGAMTTPPTVNAQRLPREELVRAIEDLQVYIRDPRSRVSGMKKFQERTLKTLRSHGYEFIDKNNLADFGKFMNRVRDLHGSKSFPSNEVAKMYKSMERLGLSPKTIEKKFGEFLTSQEGLIDLQLTLEMMGLPEGRKRVTSTEVSSKMKELGFL